MNRHNVKALRDRLGHTQEEFAARIPVSTKTVSRWELGEVSPSPLARLRLKELHQHANMSTKPDGEAMPVDTPSEASPSTLPRRRGIVPSTAP